MVSVEPGLRCPASRGPSRAVSIPVLPRAIPWSWRGTSANGRPLDLDWDKSLTHARPTPFAGLKGATGYPPALKSLALVDTSKAPEQQALGMLRINLWGTGLVAGALQKACLRSVCGPWGTWELRSPRRPGLDPHLH